MVVLYNGLCNTQRRGRVGNRGGYGENGVFIEEWDWNKGVRGDREWVLNNGVC